MRRPKDGQAEEDMDFKPGNDDSRCVRLIQAPTDMGAPTYLRDLATLIKMYPHSYIRFT